MLIFKISGRTAVFLARILALKKHLPLEIVNKIFNDEFVKQVENYRFFYNNKPLVTFHISLQRLNQIVCIEYPQYGLPWYYEEFNKFTYNKYKWVFYIHTCIHSIEYKEFSCTYNFFQIHRKNRYRDILRPTDSAWWQTAIN